MQPLISTTLYVWIVDGGSSLDSSCCCLLCVTSNFLEPWTILPECARPAISTELFRIVPSSAYNPQARSRNHPPRLLHSCQRHSSSNSTLTQLQRCLCSNATSTQGFASTSATVPAALYPQGQGRGFGVQGPPPTPPSSGMSKDQRRNAKAMAKLDKQVEAEKPRVYRPLGEEDRLEAARSAKWPAMTRDYC